MGRKTAKDFPQELLDLYDEYVHGQVGRRGFLDRASRFAVGGVTAAGLLAALSPKYALAQQVAKDDERITVSYEFKAAILLQFAENDERVNAGWPTYEEALKKAGVQYTAHHYPGTNHGFHNDTTPRYDEAAAKLAWQRTLEYFNKELAGK
jgi:dienelactone hydrolase